MGQCYACERRRKTRTAVCEAFPALAGLRARGWAPKPEARCTAAELADGLTEVLIPIRFGDLPAVAPPSATVV